MTIGDGIYTIKANERTLEADVKKRGADLYWITIMDPNERAGMGEGAKTFELEWVEAKMNGREGVTRIWGTVWEVRGDGLLREVLNELGVNA